MSVTNVLAEAASSAAYEQEHKQASNDQIAVAAAAAAAAAAAGPGMPDAGKKKGKGKKKKADAHASRVTVTVGRPVPSAAAAGAAGAARASGVPAPAPAPGVPYAHSWKEKGPQFKKGHWKKEEDQHLLAAIDRYCESKGMNEQQKLVRLALRCASVHGSNYRRDRSHLLRRLTPVHRAPGPRGRAQACARVAWRLARHRK